MGSESPPSAPGAKKPVRIGKYEVIQHIANGGMGRIYRALDTQSGQEVALKILPPEMAAKPAMVVRFKREYAAASRLRHENIVSLYELGEAGGTLYFAMELVEGVDLHEYMEKKGTLDPEEARLIVLQAARAIRHASQHGIVHRDIKPSNFLLARTSGRPVVKLLDFGLARETSGDEFRVTRAGTTVGTVDYMAPEQAKDSSLADVRSDLYSLGSTWYHLLTGRPPFPEGGLGERLIKIMNDEPPDARELNPLISDETWAVVEKLLAKSPDFRHQTPEELIADLLSLEGKATARPKSKPRSGTKKAKKSRPSHETDDDAARATSADTPPSRKPLIAILGAVALLLAAGAFFLFRGRTLPEEKKPPDEPPPVVRLDPGKGDKTDGPPLDPPPGKDKEKGKEPPVVVAKLPALHRLTAGQTVQSLRAEAEKPWAAQAVTPALAVAKVRRVGGEGYHRGIAEAIAALPADRPGAVEIHDNGPLFETPAASAGRALTVRAGKGFRPLIVWDIAALKTPGPDKDGTLTFLSSQGTLAVEGVEMACRWPDTLAHPGVFFRVAGGDLRLSDCAFSLAGRPRALVTLAVLSSEAEGVRCRLDRCLMRGQGLAGLDIAAPAAEVLVDGCLLSGLGPMLRLKAAEKPTRLRVVRSTLTASEGLIDLAPLPGVRRPGLDVLAWDCLMARSGAVGGEMLTASGEAGGVAWRAVAALYAGWGKLLAGTKSAGTLEEWRALWPQSNGDHLHRDAWPELPAEEPATRPASAYLPAGAAAFGATADPDRPLGCDLSALPPARDGWLALALEPGLLAPDAPMNDGPPDIPMPGDEMFHGARVNLDENDLGRYLEMMKTRATFGPRVVMHLFGKGERATAPIRVKGSTLVLYFEPPADEKTAPPALKPSFPGPGGPLIDVEGGGLVIINGVVRCPDSGIKLSQVVRVRGGDMRLYRTRIEGPRVTSPEGYVAALSVSGSGDTTGPEKSAVVSLNECVVTSNRTGVEIEGAGVRLHMRHCAVLSGAEALAILPGEKCAGRANVQAVLESCTFAARRAVLRLGDVGEGVVPSMPVQVRTRDCAILNPFAGKPSRAGLLAYEGDALSRGVLMWQSERDAFDPRLHHGAAAAGDPPDAKEPRAAWHRLWGSTGRSAQRPDLPGSLATFTAKSWPLEALILPLRDGPGAAMSRLGITRGKRP